MDHGTDEKRDWGIFLCSVFFVLGFSVVFSVVGILLQTALAHSSAAVQVWLGRIGGLIIIVFGLFLLGLLQPAFLTREHKFAVTHRFHSRYATSFLFGAAFAVGWTPCVSAALGAILALAATAPTGAFILLFSYTLGVGAPFLIVGLFTDRADRFIQKAGPALKYFEYLFGALLVIIGILVFVGELSRLADFQVFTTILTSLNATTSVGGGINSLTVVNVGIAFLAGLGSFLSPCILPIVPGFLSYLASTTLKKA